MFWVLLDDTRVTQLSTTETPGVTGLLCAAKLFWIHAKRALVAATVDICEKRTKGCSLMY